MAVHHLQPRWSVRDVGAPFVLLKGWAHRLTWYGERVENEKERELLSIDKGREEGLYTMKTNVPASNLHVDGSQVTGSLISACYPIQLTLQLLWSFFVIQVLDSSRPCSLPIATALWKAPFQFRAEAILKGTFQATRKECSDRFPRQMVTS